MQSRVKAASLNRALAPFIKAAKTDIASVITEDHLKKLGSALTDGARKHDASLVAEVVRDNVKSLDLDGLKRLKALLGKLTVLDTPFQRTLVNTVSDSIKDAKLREARCNLSDALTLFSQSSAGTFEYDFVVPAIQHDLLTIMDLVQPAGDVLARAVNEFPREIEFESAAFVITRPALEKWFNGHSHTQKGRVKFNLWSIANDGKLKSSSAESDQAMFAFCRTVTTLLWPDDKRHATLYN